MVKRTALRHTGRHTSLLIRGRVERYRPVEGGRVRDAAPVAVNPARHGQGSCESIREQNCVSGFPKLHIVTSRPRGSYSHGQFSIGPIADPLKLVSCHPAIVVMTRVSNPLKSADFFRVFEPRAALGFESHYPQHRGQSSDLRKLEPQIPHLMRPAATSAPDASKTHGAFGQGACCRALTASQRF